MDDVPERKTPIEPKRAKHEAIPPENLNLNLSPSARLHDMTRERIDALEAEKAGLKLEIAILRNSSRRMLDSKRR